MRMPPLPGASLACLVLAVSGCANQPAPKLGSEVSLAMAQQVLDPSAAMRRDPVPGLDGQAAKSGYDAYQKSYTAPKPQPNAFTIGVGASR